MVARTHGFVEEGNLVGRERRAPHPHATGEEFPHQAATPVRYKVDLGAPAQQGPQVLGDDAGVFDRTLGQRFVLERQDPTLVVVEHPPDRSGLAAHP